MSDLADSERQRCEVWSRAMGYFRPVSDYNAGKRQEFRDRRYFSERTALERADAAERLERGDMGRPAARDVDRSGI